MNLPEPSGYSASPTYNVFNGSNGFKWFVLTVNASAFAESMRRKTM